jgi:hypothetical protein
MTMPDNSSITQMGYVVADLEAAMRRWTDTLGAGPFQLLHHVQVVEGLYRGTPTDVDISVALAEVGGIQLELIEQHNDVPSCYRDLFAAGEEGLHHVAVQPADFDAEVARYEGLGCPQAFGGLYEGNRFVYMDTSARLGIMVELVESKD